MEAVIVAGEALYLLPERAVFWPRRNTVFVADLHLGKAAAFRAAGVAVPEGTLADDLERLSRVIESVGAVRVIILGDVLHARHGLADWLVERVAVWRRDHLHRRFVVVRGNHDRRAGDPPAGWQMTCVDEPFLDPPFALRHTPQDPGDGYVLAGHVHPAIRLRGRASLSERLPCFVVGSSRMILPAFSSFTGSSSVRPDAGDRIYAIAGDALLELLGSPRPT